MAEPEEPRFDSMIWKVAQGTD